MPWLQGRRDGRTVTAVSTRCSSTAPIFLIVLCVSTGRGVTEGAGVASNSVRELNVKVREVPGESRRRLSQYLGAGITWRWRLGSRATSKRIALIAIITQICWPGKTGVLLWGITGHLMTDGALYSANPFQHPKEYFRWCQPRRVEITLPSPVFPGQ